jgi:hypothetical protein
MDAEEREATLRAGLELFDQGRYLAAHELFEELWEATEGADSDFFKGLVQAAIALHHFQNGNPEGAAKLYVGHRRCLAEYVPTHSGLDVARLLADMQAFLRPVLERAAGAPVVFAREQRPRVHHTGKRETGTT